MSDQMLNGGRPGFSVGAVLGRGISYFIKNIVQFLLVAVLFQIPAIVVGLLAGMDLVTGSNNDAVDLTRGAVIARIVLVFLLYFAGLFVTQNFITFGIIQNLRGSRLAFGSAITRSIGAAIPAVLISIIVGIAIMLAAVAVSIVVGFIPVINLLGIIITPAVAIMIYLRWYLSIPALVVERTGIFESLSRSSHLTEGFRWHLFGVLALLIVANILIGLALGYLMPDDSMVSSIADAVLTAVIFGIGASIAAVAYHDLRIAKEGVDSGEIASVFD